MSDNFKAVMTNDCLPRHKQYWRVTIEANDINVLNNICGALNLLRSKEND